MKWELKTYEGVVDGVFLWFSNITFNGLFRMNIKTAKIEFIDFFPELSIFSKSNHKKVFLYQDKLIFLPAFSDYIHIYDTTKGRFNTISFFTSDQITEIDRVGDAVLIDDKIYIFSWVANEPLIIFDLGNYSLQKSEKFGEEIKDIKDKNKPILTRCATCGADIICFGLYGSDKIIEWNVTNNRLDIVSTGIKDIFSVSVLGEERWIVTRRGKDIFKFNGNLTRLSIGDMETWNENGRYYSGVICYRDGIIGIPAFSKDMMVYRNSKVMKIHGDRWELSDENVPAFFGITALQDEVLFLPFSADDMYVYTFSTDRIRRVRFAIDDPRARQLILKKMFAERNKGGIIYENQDYSLKEYICRL